VPQQPEAGKKPVQVAPDWKKVQLLKRPRPQNLPAAAAEAEINSAVALEILTGLRLELLLHPLPGFFMQCH